MAKCFTCQLPLVCISHFLLLLMSCYTTYCIFISNPMRHNYQMGVVSGIIFGTHGFDNTIYSFNNAQQRKQYASLYNIYLSSFVTNETTNGDVNVSSLRPCQTRQVLATDFKVDCFYPNQFETNHDQVSISRKHQVVFSIRINR